MKNMSAVLVSIPRSIGITRAISTSGSGGEIISKEGALWYTLMVIFTKATGATATTMDRVDWSHSTDQCMRGPG